MTVIQEHVSAGNIQAIIRSNNIGIKKIIIEKFVVTHNYLQVRDPISFTIFGLKQPCVRSCLSSEITKQIPVEDEV